jgi:uncharacterized protein (UPF0218 family)
LAPLRMPERLRIELSSKSFGTIFSGDPKANAEHVLKLIKSRHPPKVIIVGDFTLKVFSDSGFHPDLGIFDKRTKRSAFVGPNDFNEKISNPAGQITDEAVAAIRRLLSAPLPSTLFVEGEEDLLALPAIVQAPKGSFIIYGLPGEGIVVVTADKKTKEKINDLISQFERTS